MPATGTQFRQSESRRAIATPPSRSTSSRNASGLAASASPASAAKRQPLPGLQRPDREQRERHPEREWERGRQHDPRPHDGERPARPARLGTPFAPEHDGERERRQRDRRDCEQADAEERRERVVDEAVGDEAVAARVPEVVPEREAVLEEERALVRVCGEVRAGRPEPRECGGHRCGGCCGEQRLEDEWMSEPHGSWGSAAATGGAMRRSTGSASVR